MLIHEFYKRFANLPMEQRMILLSSNKLNPMFDKSFKDVYQSINDLDEKMRPLRIEQDRLLKAVEPFFDEVE